MRPPNRPTDATLCSRHAAGGFAAFHEHPSGRPRGCVLSRFGHRLDLGWAGRFSYRMGRTRRRRVRFFPNRHSFPHRCHARASRPSVPTVRQPREEGCGRVCGVRRRAVPGRSAGPVWRPALASPSTPSSETSAQSSRAQPHALSPPITSVEPVLLLGIPLGVNAPPSPVHGRPCEKHQETPRAPGVHRTNQQSETRQPKDHGCRAPETTMAGHAAPFRVGAFNAIAGGRSCL